MNIVFKNPQILWALFTILVPIILHFLNIRKHKTLQFSNIAILQNIEKESRNKSKIKDLLVLLSRVMLVAFLIMAFAQPFIPSEAVKVKKSDKVYLYIDNSFSMNAKGSNGSLLEEAKLVTREIVERYSANTEFILITNDETSLPLGEKKVIDRLSNISTTPVQKNINELFLQAQNESEKHFYLLSDFQKHNQDYSNIAKDSTSSYFFIHLQPETSANISIDTCWFNSPYLIHGKNEELSIRLTNHSSEPIENLPVKLTINDTVKAIKALQFKGNETIETSLGFLNTYKGTCRATIEIEDAPITYDNKLYFSFTVSEKIKILAIEERNNGKLLESLFGTDEYFSLETQNKNSINYANFNTYNAIVINELSDISSGLQSSIIEFIKDGGNALLIPKWTAPETYESILSSFGLQFVSTDTTNLRLFEINEQDDIFMNTFQSIPDNSRMPVIYKHYINKSTQFNNTTLLNLQNNDALLIKSTKGNGSLYCFTTEISSERDLMVHPVMIPVFLNIALYSKPNSALYYTIGTSKNIPYFGPKSELIELKAIKDNFSVIPQLYNYGNRSTIAIPKTILKDGHFTVNASNFQSLVSFNFDKKESEQEYASIEELTIILEKKGIQNIAFFTSNIELNIAKAVEGQLGTELWKIFILIATLFVLLEILLIKDFKFARKLS